MAATRTTPQGPSQPTLLYDGDCGVCAAFARFVAWADRKGRMRVLPVQAVEARPLLAGWSEERIAEAAHLALPDGWVASGAEALGGVLDRLPLVGSVHRRMARPRIRRVDALLYRLGTAVRGRTACALPATPSS